MPNRRNTRKNRILSNATGFAGRILVTASRGVGNLAKTAVNVARVALNGATTGVAKAANNTAHGVEGAFKKLVSRKNRKDRKSRKSRKHGGSRRNSRR